MKKAFVLLFLIPGLTITAQQVCSPTLKEIYSYNVGDVFQYRTDIFDHSTDNMNLYHFVSHQRNTVIEKIVFSDTIIIISDVRFYSWYEIPPYPNRNTKYMPSKRSYIDTILIVDSTSHFLNACDSQIVSYITGFGTYYTRALIYERNSEIIKQFGGDLYDSISGDSLIPFNDFYFYEQQYAEGKGLILLGEIRFEWNKDIILEGYAINGDTTGTIWRDEDFPVITGEVTHDAHFRIYPTIIQNSSYLYLEYDRQLSDFKIISTDGRIQAHEWVGDHAIRLVNAPAGVYIVVARFGDVFMREKIIMRE